MLNGHHIYERHQSKFGNKLEIIKIAISIVVLIAPFIILSIVTYRSSNAKKIHLQQKLNEYRSLKNNYDIVFVGDSRTYTNIHPHLVDPLLGKKSYNLGTFAHWLPTQYPFYKELIREMPKGTIVVWSVGHQNFEPYNAIQRVWQIKLSDVPQYVIWGYPLQDLSDNVMFFNPALHIFSERGKYGKAVVSEILSVPSRIRAFRRRSPFVAPSASTTGSSGNSQEIKRLNDHFGKLPFAKYANTLVDGLQITSVETYTKHGSYLRTELNPAYFRNKQSEMQSGRYRTLVPTERLMKTFVETLDVFQRNEIFLIVNEVEEAPFRYSDSESKQECRKFMQKYVRPEVERHGFKYITTDLGQLTDEDYFDWNHLNSTGAQKYTSLLVSALRRVMGN